MTTSTEPSHFDYKVLPFDGPQGHVGGHEIRVHLPHGRGLRAVVFQIFDERAQMSLEVHVPWQSWTQYMRKSWPHGGSVVAVTFEDGRRCTVEAMFANHGSNERYLAAPVITRDCVRVRALCGDHRTFLSIVGVDEYFHNGSPIVCPWERDNRAWQEELARRSA